MKATAGATSSRHFCLYLELPKQSSAVLLKAKYRQEPGEKGHTRDPDRVRSSESCGGGGSQARCRRWGLGDFEDVTVSRMSQYFPG